MLSVGKLGKPPSVPDMRGTQCMTFQKSNIKRVIRVMLLSCLAVKVLTNYTGIKSV